MAAYSHNSEASYGDNTPNDTNGWVEIDISALKPGDGTAIPFRLVANRFKSSSPHSEAFLHDPLAAMMAAAGEVEAFRAIDQTWQVTTVVANHHQTLSVWHLYAMTAVDATEKTVAVTLIKLRGKA